MKRISQLPCDSQDNAQTVDGNGINWSSPSRLILSVLIIVFFQLLAQSSWAEKYIPYGHQFEPAAKYEEKRKPAPGRGTYLKDPNVWVYTTEFAERFGLPAQWVDNTLKGAEAVAYRIEQSNTQTCGFFGETESCRPSLFCVMDIYLKDEDGAKLPWESHKLSEWRDWDRSEMFLSVQRESDDRRWHDESQNHTYIYSGAIGLRSIVYVSGKPKRLKSGTQQMFSSYSGLLMRSYRRDFFQGLDLLQLNVCLMVRDTSRPMKIHFHDPLPNMRNPIYRLPNGKINHSKLEIAEKKRFAQWAAGAGHHATQLPDAYMDKVNAHDKAVRQQRSLAAEAWRRYQQDSTKQKPSAAASFWQRLFKSN